MHAVSRKDVYEGNIVVYRMEVKNIELSSHVLREVAFSHKFCSFSSPNNSHSPRLKQINSELLSWIVF